MKIISVEPILLELPYRHNGPVVPFGGVALPSVRCLLVRVETEDGLVGWGEAFGYGVIPATIVALRTLVAPLAVGRDARDIKGLVEQIAQTVHMFGRSGPAQYAISGLDIALWDLAGKRAGCSVATLLGGHHRERIKAYSSFSINKTRDHLHVSVEIALARGFKAIKLHEVTVEAVAATREKLPDIIDLMVDTNCPWRPDEAVDMARRMQPFGLTWLEEPIWPPEDLAGLERLRDACDVPLAVGENLGNPWMFKPFVQSSAIAYLQPSVIKIGGVTQFMKVMAMAEMEGRTVAPHSPYFGPGLLATLQIAAHSPIIPIIEIVEFEMEFPVFGTVGLPEADGMITIPDAPGLGADPSPELLERFSVSIQ